MTPLPPTSISRHWKHTVTFTVESIAFDISKHTLVSEYSGAFGCARHQALNTARALPLAPCACAHSLPGLDPPAVTGLPVAHPVPLSLRRAGTGWCTVSAG